LVSCPSCGFERAVAFSCKKRGGICPSCMGRRMNDTAIHLVDRVLPLDTPILFSPEKFVDGCFLFQKP